jgi:pilus assembly protein CpaB
MKAARLVVLTVAVTAGGVAAMLAGRTERQPVVEVKQDTNTVDVLIAKSDIPMGQKVTPADMQWQAWPVSALAGNLIRKTENPNAVEQLSDNIACAPFFAGEPIREAKLVNAKGSGFLAAILPSGMRAISTQISAETRSRPFANRQEPSHHRSGCVTKPI